MTVLPLHNFVPALLCPCHAPTLPSDHSAQLISCPAPTLLLPCYPLLCPPPPLSACFYLPCPALPCSPLSLSCSALLCPALLCPLPHLVISLPCPALTALPCSALIWPARPPPTFSLSFPALLCYPLLCPALPCMPPHNPAFSLPCPAHPALLSPSCLPCPAPVPAPCTALLCPILPAYLTQFYFLINAGRH